MDNRWTEQFKDKMQDYRETAPDGLWEDISSSGFMLPERKKGRTVVFSGLAVIAAAAALALFVIFRSGQSNVPDVEILASSQASPATPEPAATPVPPATPATHVKTIPAAPAIPSAESVRDIPSVPSETSDTYDTSIPTVPSVQDNQDDQDIQHSQDIQEKNDTGIRLLADAADQTRPRKKKISLSASFSSGMGNNTSSPGYSGAIVASSSVTSFGSSPENEIRLFNRNREVTSGTSYRQPVKVGVSARFHISDRWSIATGVDWIWLHSSFREGSDSYYTSRTSDMHYIGIPLTVNFDIWQGHGLNFYATAGGEVEKCVYGKQRTGYVYNSVSGLPEYEKMTEKQLQWSICAGVGLEYYFTPFAGIYVEPGIAWYPDNGSQVDNVYKSRPFNFSLSIGIRFNLR